MWTTVPLAQNCICGFFVLCILPFYYFIFAPFLYFVFVLFCIFWHQNVICFSHGTKIQDREGNGCFFLLKTRIVGKYICVRNEGFQAHWKRPTSCRRCCFCAKRLFIVLQAGRKPSLLAFWIIVWPFREIDIIGMYTNMTNGESVTGICSELIFFGT